MILLFRNSGCFDRATPSALLDATEFPIYVRRYISEICSSSPAFVFLLVFACIPSGALLPKFGY